MSKDLGVELLSHVEHVCFSSKKLLDFSKQLYYFTFLPTGSENSSCSTFSPTLHYVHLFTFSQSAKAYCYLIAVLIGVLFLRKWKNTANSIVKCQGSKKQEHFEKWGIVSIWLGAKTRAKYPVDLRAARSFVTLIWVISETKVKSSSETPIAFCSQT